MEKRSTPQLQELLTEGETEASFVDKKITTINSATVFRDTFELKTPQSDEIANPMPVVAEQTCKTEHDSDGRPSASTLEMQSPQSRETAILCWAVCILLTVFLIICTFVMSDLVGSSILALVLTFPITIKMSLVIDEHIELFRYARLDIKERRQAQQSPPQITQTTEPVPTSLSVQTTTTAVIPGPSSPAPSNPTALISTQTRTVDTSGMAATQSFHLPRRQDTEADIGLVPLRRRRSNGV